MNKVPEKLAALNEAFLRAYTYAPKEVVDDLRVRVNEYIGALMTIDIEKHWCQVCGARGAENWLRYTSAGKQWAECKNCREYMVVVGDA